MPAISIDEIVATDSDWLNNQLIVCSGEIDSRLAKRYTTPFTQAPIPNQLKIWLSNLVDIRAYVHLGINANDQQIQMVLDNEVTAKVEMKEASDAVNGLFDLPLRQDIPGSGITAPRVLSTSDASPYRWIRTQAQRVRYGR